jgi:hypothetical protein
VFVCVFEKTMVDQTLSQALPLSQVAAESKDIGAFTFFEILRLEH